MTLTTAISKARSRGWTSNLSRTEEASLHLETIKASGGLFKGLNKERDITIE